MRKCQTLSILVILTCLCALPAFSQKSTFAGINFIFESTSGPLRPGLGLAFERQITKHSGIETGLYYHNYVSTQYLFFQGPGGPTPATLTISERLLSVPVLYKFFSRILNVSAGPAFDFYTGWRQRNKTAALTVTDHSVDPNFSVGGIVKISKRFPVGNKIFLEPELRYQVNFTFEREYAGFGVAAKYQLR